MALLKNNPGVLCLAALLVISATFLSCDASYGIRGCKDPVNGIPSQCQIYCRDNGFVLEKGKCAPDSGKPNRMCCCYK
ncbi:hypothetical protein VPH35_016329 [Triticum aestivum]